MTTEIAQARLPTGLIKEMDSLVKKGMYSNRSDVIKDAVRRLVLNNLVGILPDTGDSVSEIRELRKKMSKKKVNLKELNKL